MLRRIRWVLYGVVAVALVASGALWLRASGIDVARLGSTGISASVAVGGPFSLTDDHGNAVTDQTWRGRWMLVYFGYTFCPDVCPTTLNAVASYLTEQPIPDLTSGFRAARRPQSTWRPTTSARTTAPLWRRRQPPRHAGAGRCSTARKTALGWACGASSTLLLQ